MIDHILYFVSGLGFGSAISSFVYAYRFRKLTRELDRIRKNYEGFYATFPADLRQALLDGTVTFAEVNTEHEHPPHSPTKH